MTHDEQTLNGLAALDAATTLLQRIRSSHPWAGLYEAADLQWWWRVPRVTDALPQSFWFDETGAPVAAAIITAWADAVTVDPIVAPEAGADAIVTVLRRGLEQAHAAGLHAVEVVIDVADDRTRALLADLGFAIVRPSVVEAWLGAPSMPRSASLPDGYRILDRRGADGPHHLVERSGADVDARLRQTSLYRPDLDLVVRGERGSVAAYGLFWLDSVTGVGLVEPMRTEAEHRRRGLARAVLVEGIERLTAAGATRVKVCYEHGNAAARALYLGVGFEATRATVVLAVP